MVGPFQPPSYSERLAQWLESNEKLPLSKYRDRPRILTNRIAASVLLGREVDAYREQLDVVRRELDAQPQNAVLGWGHLASAALLLTGEADVEARRCVEEYNALPASVLRGAPGAEFTANYDYDDMALAAARLIGDGPTAERARERRVRTPVGTSVMLGAEVLFLTDLAGCPDGVDGEVPMLSALRGILHRITVSLNDSCAPFVLALGSLAGAQTRAWLTGQIHSYDKHCWAGEGRPYVVIPQRLELPSGRPVIRLVAAAVPAGTVRLDAVEFPPLVRGLPDTLTGLKRDLDERGRRRFNLLRKRPDTVLDVAVTGVELTGNGIFSARIAAALELMGPAGYLGYRVVTSGVG
jgi:hypothetical protein